MHQRLLLLFIQILCAIELSAFAGNSFAEEVGLDLPNNEEQTRPVVVPNPLSNILQAEAYPPVKGEFSRDKITAYNFGNSTWNKLDVVQQGTYIQNVYSALIAQRGYKYLKASVLTCISFHETGTSINNGPWQFHPQAKNPKSSASGLGQIIAGTAKDLFLRGQWRSNLTYSVSGNKALNEVNDGATFFKDTALSMTAQMELAAAVLEQKRKDCSCKMPAAVYAYGDGTSSYPKKIMKCADSIDANNGTVTLAALLLAKGVGPKPTKKKKK